MARTAETLGSVEAIGARIDEHRAAGADHVAIQVLPMAGQSRVEVLTAIAAERGLTAPENSPWPELGVLP